MIGGYNTTATGLTFTLYLLAKHQEIQTRLREEICRKHQSNDSNNYCYFDNSHCELLDRVWYESLRLYPPVVTTMTRELDDQIDKVQLSFLSSSSAGQKSLALTRDIAIQIPIWTIHHNATYWPEPNRFNPYRENLPIPSSSPLSSNFKNLSPAQFLPFGFGQRSCVGNILANSVARAVLTAILKQYKLELLKQTEEGLDPETGLLRLTSKNMTIKPEKVIYLRLVPVINS